MTFARIKEACERPEYHPEGWVFAVLTLDREGYYSGRRWPDATTAYRELSRMSRNYLARVRRLCRRRGWASPGSSWVAVVEAHRSGWPHVNLVVYAPELAAELEAARMSRLAIGATDRESRLMHGDLLSCATETGWGRQSTAERVRSRDALAGYVTKLAGQADATSGELAKLTQAPLNAPERFRRLRSGKGFLPPRRKNEEWIGTLTRRENDPMRAAYGAIPLHDIRDPATMAIAAWCCILEEQRIEREWRRTIGAHGVDHYARVGGSYVLIDPEIARLIDRDRWRATGFSGVMGDAAVSVPGPSG